MNAAISMNMIHAATTNNETDFLKGLFRHACALCICLLILITPTAATAQPTPPPESAAISNILAWKDIATTTAPLAATAGRGNADWYVLALTQLPTPPDFSPYLNALRHYLATAPSLLHTDRLRISLTLQALGESATYADFIDETLAHPAETLSAHIFALRLSNAMSYKSGELPSALLTLQLPGGGWALRGNVADPDLTAMAIQALAPHATDNTIATAINTALLCLSTQQQNNGGYASWGSASCESTAQVLLALAACHLNPLTDPRFIKGNSTLLDNLLSYATPSGAFSHTPNGTPNDTATAQALTALLALPPSTAVIPTTIIPTTPAAATPTATPTATATTTITHTTPAPTAPATAITPSTMSTTATTVAATTIIIIPPPLPSSKPRIPLKPLIAVSILFLAGTTDRKSVV